MVNNIIMSHKITPEDMHYRLENEGIGYAILNYYGKVESDDIVAEKLWNDAHKSLTKLQSYLDNYVKNKDDISKDNVSKASTSPIC